MLDDTIHPAQIQILYVLRHVTTARFSELMHPTGLQSDVFKFHLRKLVQLGYIEKLPDGRYCLSPKGKEFANNLDSSERKVQKQPKLSVMLVVSQLSATGEPVYLLHRRKRHPYFGFWGHMSGPIQWGETPEATAARELQKQTGLSADFTIEAFYRQRDYNSEATPTLFEDKLFVILRAQIIQGTLTNTWNGGTSEWMTLADIERQDKVFTSTSEVATLAAGRYISRDMYYESEHY